MKNLLTALLIFTSFSAYSQVLPWQSTGTPTIQRRITVGPPADTLYRFSNGSYGFVYFKSLEATQNYVDSLGVRLQDSLDLKADKTTTVTAGSGLTGGGDLSGNRTLAIDATVATLTGTQTLTNKTLTSPVINSPTGIVKGDVGLGNVNNTSDADKPVSAATQTALDLKSNKSNFINIVDIGGIGDSVTDNTTVINSALDAYKEIYFPEGDYLVTSLNNYLGSKITGSGRIVKVVTGGFQQLNIGNDFNSFIFGQEYLHFFQNKLLTRADAGTQLKILWTGDSTTSGDATTAGYTLTELFDFLCKKNSIANIRSLNRGHGGQTSVQWKNSHLANDLAENPDMYIIRWGINDPAFDTSVANFEANLRTALTTLRVSKTQAQMSVILMTPNSVSDVPNNRDEKWFEQIRKVYIKAARDFQCGFIDTYSLWLDSRNGAAGLYMDDPYADGRAIHPKNIFNTWITSKVFDFVFPKTFFDKVSVGKFINESSVDNLPLLSTLPSIYNYGLTISRAVTANSFAVDGTVLNFKNSDNVGGQLNFSSLNPTVPEIYFRTFRNAVGDSFGTNVRLWNSANLRSDTENDAVYVNISGTQTISGAKTFSQIIKTNDAWLRGNGTGVTVLSNNTASGNIYLRPNGDVSAGGEVRIESSGRLISTAPPGTAPFVVASTTEVANLRAATVTTNANLTGPITSSGNATSIASQTGTGSTFVMSTSPTLVTPNLGTPSAGVATNLTGTASGLTSGNVTTNANLTGDVTSVGNVTSIAAGAIVDADINASAAIDATKIADGTVTSTEFQYINSVTSNVQTQLDSKLTVASVPVQLFDNYTTVGNVSTTETDLATYTIPANRLANNGEKINFKYSGKTSATGGAIKVYLDGNLIFSSTTSGVSWSITGYIIRVSSTVVRYSIDENVYAFSSNDVNEELTGLTLSNTNILKVTGTGTSNDDITYTLGTGEWKPAAL